MRIQDYPMRGCDKQGCGYFGAPRGSRKHRGIDIECLANAGINSIVSGKVTKVGKPYYDEGNSRNRNHYRYVEVTKGDYRFRIYYISPMVKVGDEVDAGDLIGYSQDLTEVYPDITQHCHLEIKNKDGEYIDPTPVYLALQEDIYG